MNSGGLFVGANGYVSIDFVGQAVPEPSTWAMMLAGFSALVGMLLRRGRKGITPDLIGDESDCVEKGPGAPLILIRHGKGGKNRNVIL